MGKLLAFLRFEAQKLLASCLVFRKFEAQNLKNGVANKKKCVPIFRPRLMANPIINYGLPKESAYAVLKFKILEKVLNSINLEEERFFWFCYITVNMLKENEHML